MIGRHPSATRTDPLFPATTLFRAPAGEARAAARGDIVEVQRVGARPAGDPRRPAEVRIGQIGQPRAVVVAAHIDHAMHDAAAVPDEAAGARSLSAWPRPDGRGPSPFNPAQKLGRASCRERVCPSGLIFVVAGTLKKKANIRRKATKIVTKDKS